MHKIKVFDSVAEASNELHVSYTGISKCCLEKQKTCGGFIFKYNK